MEGGGETNQPNPSNTKCDCKLFPGSRVSRFQEHTTQNYTKVYTRPCPRAGSISLAVHRMTRTPGCNTPGPISALDPRPRTQAGGGQESGASHVGPFRQFPTSFVSHRPELRKLFRRVTAKGRPRSLERLFPCNPGGRQAREGRGGGGRAEGPVFAFISSNRRFYLWKRTDAGD